jgi:hypothetical protein
VTGGAVVSPADKKGVKKDAKGGKNPNVPDPFSIKNDV